MGRRRDKLDHRLEAWAAGTDPALGRLVPLMPGELREILDLHYRDPRLFKQKREAFGGSTALYWQKWHEARSWIYGALAVMAEVRRARLGACRDP